MAKRVAIPSRHTQLKLVGSKDTLTIPRVQSLSVTADRPTTDIDELGNRLHAGTVEDVPAVTATFRAFDVGVKLFGILTGTDYTAYPASGVSITAIKDVDVIVNIRDEQLEDYVKAAHARRCAVRDFSFSYSVDGESTEEYTVIGSNKRWFKNDVYVDRFTTGTTSFTLNKTPVVLKNGNYALTVILDGVYLEEVTGTPATGEYKIVGTTLTTFDTRSSQLLVVYQIAGSSGDAWVDVSDSTMPAAVRGIDVPVLLSANNIRRVQSITLNGSFNPQGVKEHGNRDMVGYVTQTPGVTGTITVLDTDTELVALFTTGQLVPSGVTEFGVSEYTFSGITLDVQILDPAVKVNPPVLKTLYIPDVVITNDGFTSNVNQNAQQTFEFRSKTGELVVYSGERP